MELTLKGQTPERVSSKGEVLSKKNGLIVTCMVKHKFPANKHNCWNGLCYWGHVTRNIKYINHRSLKCVVALKCSIVIRYSKYCISIPYSVFNIVLRGKRLFWRCPWCNGYRRRKWTWRHEFKSWMRLIAFHIALIPLGKVWIQLFSLQLWVNSRAD